MQQAPHLGFYNRGEHQFVGLPQKSYGNVSGCLEMGVKCLINQILVFSVSFTDLPFGTVSLYGALEVLFRYGNQYRHQFLIGIRLYGAENGT